MKEKVVSSATAIVQLPAETLRLTYASGITEVIECQPIKVPLDETGLPAVQRMEVDSFNNLRVVENAESFRLIHANCWESAHIKEHSKILKAV